MKTYSQLRSELLHKHPFLSWECSTENIDKGTFVLFSSQLGAFAKLAIAYPTNGKYLCWEGGQVVIKDLPFPKVRKLPRLVVRLKGFKHGNSGYGQGCRCKKCTAAASDHVRRWRANNACSGLAVTYPCSECGAQDEDSHAWLCLKNPANR